MKNTIVCLVFCVFVSASCTAQTCTDGNCSISSAKSLALNSGFALFDGNCFTFERSFEIAKISGKFCAEMNQTFVNIQVLGSHVAVLSFADGESLSCTEATQMVSSPIQCLI